MSRSILAILGILVTTGCAAHQDAVPIRIVCGRAVDAETRQPLSARVTLAPQGAVTKSLLTETAVDGSFELPCDCSGVLSISAPEHVGLDVTAHAIDASSSGSCPDYALQQGDGVPAREYVGVGVRLGVDGASVVVAEVIPSGSAVGLLSEGDRIIAVDSVEVTAKDAAETRSLLLGPDGSEVVVRFTRGGTTREVRLVRKRYSASR